MQIFKFQISLINEKLGKQHYIAALGSGRNIKRHQPMRTMMSSLVA